MQEVKNRENDERHESTNPGDRLGRVLTFADVVGDSEARSKRNHELKGENHVGVVDLDCRPRVFSTEFSAS